MTSEHTVCLEPRVTCGTILEHTVTFCDKSHSVFLSSYNWQCCNNLVIVIFLMLAEFTKNCADIGSNT